MMNKKRVLSMIVPCYNEEESLPLFYIEISKVLLNLNVDYEVIIVDDGSKDKTIDKIKELIKIDPRIKYISFSRNFGKEAAMYAGLCSSKGDYVGFIDADLQHPPLLIEKMMKVLESEKYDCAACRRVDRKGDSKIKTWFSKSFYKIVNSISEFQMIDGAGDFRIMNRKMADAIISLSEINRFSKGIFSWVGFKTYWIDYNNVDRIAGKTSWSFIGLVRYAVDGLISFSNLPLNLVSIFGIIMTLFSFLYLFFIVIKYLLFGDSVQGWTTIVCIILLIGGIQLLSLGILGQYIGKIFIETKKRPIYIIESTNIENENTIK